LAYVSVRVPIPDVHRHGLRVGSDIPDCLM
jgi:hypothetical protein